MASAAKSSTSLFVSNVALFGSQISQALHNFVSLEDHVSRGFRASLKHLDATVHVLNRLSSLLGADQQQAALFSEEGLRYVETLAEECSVAMNTIKTIAGGEDVYWFNPKHWKSVTSIGENGYKAFVVPELDEVAFFRALKQSKKANDALSLRIDPTDISSRLEELQLLLLLVVQVVTVRDMTNKLPSGEVDLESVVEYHNRVKRAAEKAHLAHRSGRVLSARRRRFKSYASSSSDSDSDSEVSFSSRSRSPPRRYFKAPPPPRQAGPPPPPGWRGPPCPPPMWIGPNPPHLQRSPVAMTTPSQIIDGFTGPPANRKLPPPPSSSPSEQFPRVVELEMGSSKNTADNYPPSYSEREKEPATPKLEPEKLETAKGNHAKESLNLEMKETDEKDQEEASTKLSLKPLTLNIPNGNDSRLLKSSSFFRVKFKSLFRSKSSLEAEMKQSLADANASLTAFVVQHGEFSKIPHSAFHSLEYTHMRTILSQLKDNSWFKTFSDMTDAEHETLDRVLQDRIEGGRCYKRELIVLKVLQQNRFNAWARVIEQAFQTSFGIQHFENYRIVLAIVREKDTGLPVVESSLTQPAPARVVERYPPPDLLRVPDPLPTMPRDGKMIVDLERPSPPALGIGRRGPPESAFEPSQYLPSRGPPPFPPQQNPLFQSPTQVDVTPRNPITEELALDALTSYAAYTLRPAPVQQSALSPLSEDHPSSWVRCFLTRELESKFDLLQRIEKFKKRGVAVIDHKLQLTEPQSSQITRLVEDVNHLEFDTRFEHKIVELSMVDRFQGVLSKVLPNSNIDVIHLIVQRTLKDGYQPMATYGSLMRHPVPPPPPPPPPPLAPPVIMREEPNFVVVEPARARSRTKGAEILPRSVWRRSLSTLSSDFSSSSSSTYSGSDSDSTSYTIVTCRSGPEKVKVLKRGGRRKNASSIGSESSYGEESKPRWKIDPSKIKFSRTEVGNDVVQLLLDRWTPVMGKGKEKEKESFVTKTSVRTERNKATVEDWLD